MVILMVHTQTHRHTHFTNCVNPNDVHYTQNRELLMKARLYPFVNVSMLQLDESCADGSDVTLLIGEGHSPRPLRVLELRIGVNSRIADSAIEAIHNHGQLN